MMLGQGVCKLHFPVNQVASWSVLPIEGNRRKLESKGRREETHPSVFSVSLWSWWLQPSPSLSTSRTSLVAPPLRFQKQPFATPFSEVWGPTMGSSFNLLGPGSFLAYPQYLGLELGAPSWVISIWVTAMFLFCSFTFKHSCYQFSI